MIPCRSMTGSAVRRWRNRPRPPKAAGYPAFWSYKSYQTPLELVIVDDKKVGIRIDGTRRLVPGQDHEGNLSDIGLAFSDIQMQALREGKAPPLSIDECAEGLKERFADAPDRESKWNQIDSLCEDKNRAFLPQLVDYDDDSPEAMMPAPTPFELPTDALAYPDISSGGLKRPEARSLITSGTVKAVKPPPAAGKGRREPRGHAFHQRSDKQRPR